MQRLKGLLFLGGVALLVYALAVVDLRAVTAALLRLRWWFLLVLLSTLAVQLLRTLGWSLVLRGCGDRIPFADLYRVRLMGEALNYLSAMGPFLGDPTKAWLLRSQTGANGAVASVVFDRYLYSIAALLFTAGAVSPWLSGWSLGALWLLALSMALTPLGVSRYARRLSRSRMYGVMAVHTVSHLFLALEVAVILHALGVEAGFSRALFVEGMSKGINLLFFFVPMRLGVFEGGHAVLLHYLNMSAALGLTVGLVRRLRSLFWSGLGLLLLLKSSRLRQLRVCHSGETL